MTNYDNLTTEQLQEEWRYHNQMYWYYEAADAHYDAEKSRYHSRETAKIADILKERGEKDDTSTN